MNCPAGYIPLKKACWKINSSAATQANAEAACQADRTGQFTSGNFLLISKIGIFEKRFRTVDIFERLLLL